MSRSIAFMSYLPIKSIISMRPESPRELWDQAGCAIDFEIERPGYRAVDDQDNAAMTHIAIQEALNGKVVDWMEKVSDEQYNGQSK